MKNRIIELYEARTDDKRIYPQIAETIYNEFGVKKSEEAIRSIIRRHKKQNGIASKPDTTDIETRILKAIKKPITIDNLADNLKLHSKIVKAYIETMIEQGKNISLVDNRVWIEKRAVEDYKVFEEKYSGETEIWFALIGDTHLGSKKQQLTHLNDFYDKCVEYGVSKVYHAGDITDGDGRRAGQQYEIIVHGADEQSDYVIEHYPRRSGITTEFINGNHDLWHMQYGGTNIGKRIAAARDDLIYLGNLSAKVWITPKCDLDLVHPLDGAAYAISYSGQKYIDAIQGGSKPLIMAIGHHHKAMFYEYRNIQVFESMCFQAQTDWERGKRISVSVGGWIVDLKLKPDGQVYEIVPRKIQYYYMNEHDY